MEQLESDVLSRDNYHYHHTITEERWKSSFWETWFSTTTTPQKVTLWFKKLEEVIVKYTFVSLYSSIFEDSGLRDIFNNTNDDDPNDNPDLHKLDTAARLVFLNPHFLPFMTYSTRDWKKQMQLTMYRTIFHHEDSRDQSRILSASYLLVECEDLKETEEVFQKIMDITTRREDWDAYDLLLRIMERNPARYFHRFHQALETFAERFRYHRQTRQRKNEYDVFVRTPIIHHNRIVNNDGNVGNVGHLFTQPPEPQQLDNDDDNDGDNDGDNDNNDQILKNNMFSDTQNVHESSLQKSSRKSLEILYDWFSDYLESKILEDSQYQPLTDLEIIQNTFLHDIMDNFHNFNISKISEISEIPDPTKDNQFLQIDNQVQGFFRRILHDPSILVLFDDPEDPKDPNNRSSVVISLRDVVVWLWAYIESRPLEDERKELKKRLLEECQEGHGTCYSGHVSRLVNVLVGFFPGIEMKMSIESIVRVHLQKVLQEYILEEEDKNTTSTITMDMMEKSGEGFRRFSRWTHKRKKDIRKRVMTYAEQSGYDLKTEREEVQRALEVSWDKIFPEHGGKMRKKKNALGRLKYQWKRIFSLFP